MTDYVLHDIKPPIPHLGFRVALPSDWRLPEIPQEEADFGDPTKFMGLLLAAAPYATIFLTVGARPAYDDGVLDNWALYLLEAAGLKPRAMGPQKIGRWTGLGGVAPMKQEGTAFDFRFAFFADAGRLIQLSLLAPEPLSQGMEPVWQEALRKFDLNAAPETAVPAPAASAPEPEPEPEPPQRAAPKEAEAPVDGPPWWRKAVALERQNKLDEAEKTIRDGTGNILGGLISTADLYRRRRDRLLKAGDRSGAEAAHKQAVDFAYAYAAGATSGGEGAALSRERDAFLSELGSM